MQMYMVRSHWSMLHRPMPYPKTVAATALQSGRL